MATPEEIVEMWDEKHPNQKTEIQTHYKNQKIASGKRNERFDRWAVIRLADDASFEPWGEQLCYILDFQESATFKIGFYRRNGAPCDAKALEAELKKFEGKKINNNVLLFKKTNEDSLMLRAEFDKNTSSAKEICDFMEKFIKLTQNPLCKVLGKKFPQQKKIPNILRYAILLILLILIIGGIVVQTK